MTRDLPSLSIHKFGGAALADAAAVERAATIIARRRPAPMVIVASALAGITDALLAVALRATTGDAVRAHAEVARLRDRHLTLADALLEPEPRAAIHEAIVSSFAELDEIAAGLAALRELTPRTMDHVIARGERLAARTLAATLKAHGVPAEFVDAAELIHTDGRFGNAAPDLERTERAAGPALDALRHREVVPVVPGFVGIGAEGATVTLGRGGSDLTATVLAAVLRAPEVVLWKDVPGLLTADPRIVPGARIIPQLNVREAAELAYYGAKVLHPRALIPLGPETRLYVRPFADPEAVGTEISTRRHLTGSPVKALSGIGGQALVTVSGNGMLGVPGIAGRTFAALHGAGISVSLISQASSEHSICFTVPEAVAAEAQARLTDTFAAELARREINGIEVQRGLATVAVVGLGMAGERGVAARVCGAVADAGINIVAIAQGSSELNISLVLDGAHAAAAQRAIHASFRLDKVGGGKVEHTRHVDVVLLGFGKIGRELTTQLAKINKRASSSVRIVGVLDREGMVFDPDGLSRRRLATLVALKERGASVADAPEGRRLGAVEAVAEIAAHALSRPVLADVAFGDTRPVLHAALAHGMDLVLANKVPLAAEGRAGDGILRAAHAHGRRVLHEATVGAGLPIIDTIYKLVDSGDRILSIESCPSGTMAYLFGEIGRGQRFSHALRAAMAAGYTEPDPREDLSGMDVARKALILGRLAGYPGGLDAVAVESLVPEEMRDVPLDRFLACVDEQDDVWAARVRAARARGEKLCYRARVTRRAVDVGLAAVSATNPLAASESTDVQFVFTTSRYRATPLVISGPGAGPAVTAAGVLNDLLRLARE
jgi:aspartokinase/homoserine dehydrogenase 1